MAFFSPGWALVWMLSAVEMPLVTPPEALTGQAGSTAVSVRVPASPPQGCLDLANRSDLGPGSWVRLSPDATKYVTYISESGINDIYVIDIKTLVKTQITKEQGDNIHPEWLADGSGLVFSSNRAGSYDLWVQEVSEKAVARRLTYEDGDELKPTVSPIPYRLMALTLEGCGGPAAYPHATYSKVVFEHRKSADASDIRFVSADGLQSGLVIGGCRSPQFTSDGLALAMNCDSSLVVLDAEVLSVSQAVEEYQSGVERGEYPSITRLRSEQEEQERRAPREGRDSGSSVSARVARHFTTFGAPSFEAKASRDSVPVLTHNQLLVLEASASESKNLRTWSRDANSGPPVDLGLAAGVADFGPDGRWMAWSDGAVGDGRVFAAPWTCPLADVGDLVHYPELWKGGIPSSLANNGFVGLRGDDKEFYHIYEKARYAERGILVTPDTMLQAFSDSFSRLLQEREIRMAEDLLAWTSAAFDLAVGLKGESGLYLQVLLAGPKVLLEAGLPLMAPPEVPEFLLEDQAPKRNVEAEYAAGLAAALDRLPPLVRAGVEADLKLLEQGEVKNRTVGGAEYIVDYSLAKVRGHYTAPGYRQYFMAMQWLSLMPYPLDKTGITFASVMASNKDLQARQEAVAAAIAALAGPVALPSIEHVVAAYPESRRIPDSALEAEAAVGKVFGPVRMRTPTMALSRGDAIEVRLFPPRLVADTEIFKAMTFPNIKNRGIPSSLDVFAVLGVPGVVDLVEIPQGEGWGRSQYEAAVKAAGQSFVRSSGQPTIYEDWLGILRDLAVYQTEPGWVMPGFTKSSEYRHRLLLTSLAGFAQVKHHLVLYTAQDMAVECDAETVVALLYEVPVKPDPPAWVEPVPGFYAGLARLARRAEALLGAPVVADVDNSAREAVEPGSIEYYFPPKWEGPGMYERLALMCEFMEKASRKHLAGQPLTPEEEEAVRLIGGALEEFVAGNMRYGEAPMALGGDQGRNERGITLVADLLYNPTRQSVLHNGIGLPYDYFVLVPARDSVTGRAVVQGGMLSWYEFQASERMTDEQWWANVKAGKLPPEPAWSCAFVQCSDPVLRPSESGGPLEPVQ